MMGIEYRQVANHSIEGSKYIGETQRGSSAGWSLGACEPESVWRALDGMLWWQSLNGPLRDP